MSTKHSTTIKFVEDDCSYKLEKYTSEKHEENQKQVSKINDLLDYIDNLNAKVDENLKIIQDLRQNYSVKINELQNLVNKKDLEIIEIKNFYEAKVNASNLQFDDEKSKIINSYEDNLNKYN